MRKSFLDMTRSILCTSLILLLIASMFLATVGAQPTYISPNPLEYTVSEISDSFTVDINVTDVTNLVGVGVFVWYNTTMLDAVNCTANPAATNLAPVDPDTYEWIPINDTLGRILFGFTFWPPKSGNLTLVTINFTATALGTCSLTINGTSLVDAGASEIPHEVIDGSITVIPEFPAAIVLSLLLIAASVSAFLGKMLWSKKRKDALITE